MNTTKRPKINKMGVVGILVLIIFACMFLCLGGYYVSGYLLTRMVDSRYTQRNCDALIPLAGTTTKIFPERIAPFTKSIQIQLRECQLYVQAKANYTQKIWPSAYQDYVSYLKTYPKGIFQKEARSAAADSLHRWAQDRLKNQDFAGAEADLFTLRDSYAGILPATQTDQTLAEVYIAWAKSLEDGKKFADAETKYKQAMETDPQPNTASGPAALAQAALPELQRNWGKELLAAKKYDEAVDHFKKAISLMKAGNTGPVSDELSQAYVQWAKSLSSSADFKAALDKITLADQTAASAAIKDQAKTARSGTIDAFSKSSSTQAQDLMSQAAASVCTNKRAATPQVPILSLDATIKRVLLYGFDFTLSNSVWAKTPATSYYVACITAREKTVQSCPYNGGYSIKRVTTDWLVEVRNLLTGKIYRQGTLAGASPESCPYVHTFTSGVYSDTHTGGPPTQSNLEAWLSKFIK